MSIDTDAVHIWFTFLDDIEDGGLLEEYRKIVPAEDLTRMEKFHYDRHKKRYLTGRVLARTVLSKFTGTPPGLITFSRTSFGRPYLKEQTQHRDIRFSISYTEKLIAFAIVLKGDVGIDVECTAVDVDCLDIAKQHFSPSEYSDLAHQPENRIKDRFFRYWTLKESYVKARGRGLTLPLDQFSFSIPSRGSEKIRLTLSAVGDESYWHFRLMEPSPKHKAALSVYRETDAPFHIATKKIVPLSFESEFKCM